MHRRLVSLWLAILLVAALLPGRLLAADAPAVTMGLLPSVTDADEIGVRGTAPRGQVVVLSVNGMLVARVISGPSMDVYKFAVPLSPGANQIVADLEGTDARAEADVFRAVARFADMEDHWARLDVAMLATLGIVNGIGGDRFGPDLPLTRAQFAKLVVLGLDLNPPAVPELQFADREAIPGWAHGYVAAATGAGLIKGFDDGTFKPDEPVTRAQVAVIAARALRLKGITAGELEPQAFADDQAIPDWARADVDLMVRAGLIASFWGDQFAPSRPATRAEAAAVVRRLYTARP
jgi:hypothetical protein